MGRLKRDHGGWSTSGKWLKYQDPKIKEDLPRGKSKKNTNKWCRGKVGVEHNFHQKVHFRIETRTYYTTRCVECGKAVVKKRVKSYPLHIEIKDNDYRPDPIQVKVNGRAIPFNVCQLESLQLEHWHYCERCNKWH